jgi:hypothetical protein
MSAIFETKIARFDEADERLETLTRAIRAFVDCWAPRLQDAEASKKRALAHYDAVHPQGAAHLSRALLAAQYDADINAQVRDGKRHRQGLDRLVLFYLGEDLDPEECTQH